MNKNTPKWGYLDAYGYVKEAFNRSVAIGAAAEELADHALDNGWTGDRDTFFVDIGHISPQGDVIDPENPELRLTITETIELIVWYENGEFKRRRPRKSDCWRLR